jgi:hypothetical protein
MLALAVAGGCLDDLVHAAACAVVTNGGLGWTGAHAGWNRDEGVRWADWVCPGRCCLCALGKGGAGCETGLVWSVDVGCLH